jgi:outer membrane protein, multidrug efflux system
MRLLLSRAGRRQIQRAAPAAALAAAALCVAGASACALKPPPDTAAIKEQALPGVTPPAGWGGPTGQGTISDTWIAGFNDEQLTAAVAEAIARNADLRVGAARVLQAQHVARLAGANLYPSADIIAAGGGKMSGDRSGLKGAAFNVAWELDLWGRVRYGRAAAVADAAATQADYNFARQSIAALVAKTWFMTTEATLQAEVARNTIRENEELVRLADTRLQVGAGNEEDVFVARASVGTYRDSLRQIEQARVESIRALEILLGRYPAAAATVSSKLPDQPAAIPAGLPSELLERRPDVIAAERRIAAAFNRRQEARMARLPAIALTGGVNTISSELFVLQDRDNPVWSAGARLPRGCSRPSSAAARSRRRSTSAPPSSSRRLPPMRASACARSAKSRMRSPPRLPRAIASRSWRRRSPTINARSKSCARSSRSAAPTFGS